MNELFDSITNLVWLRPHFLWLLLLLPLLALLTWRQSKQKGSWHSVIDSHLLQFLLQSGRSKKSYLPMAGLMLALFIAVVSAAGPSFKKQSVPVFRTGDARVIILDLSLSMDAVDVKPSRITRAKHKVMDILESAKEGETGLIVYAGDAFVISPLTSDANTIATMVPVLSTGVMPILGSEPYSAFREAVQLLKNAGKQQGHLIWITDGIDDIDVELINDVLTGEQFSVSVLTIGTRQGAPIPLPNNKGFLKDSSGQIVMPSLRMKPLQDLANTINANIVSLTADSSDVEQIMAFQKSSNDTSDESEENIQNQLDQGFWLLFLLCPLALLMFRKNTRLPGISFSLIVCCMLVSSPSHAGFWDDLWLTKDQQAQKALQKGEANKAAELFEDKNWKANAQYQAGDYQAAEKIYSTGETTTQHYNLGNALAKQQKFDEAIAAYDKVLEQNPNHEDALFNKNLLEKIKEQQQQNQQNQENDQQQEQDNSSQQEQSDQQDQSQEQSEEQQQQSQEQSQEQQQTEQQKQEQLEQQEDNRSEQEKQQALEQWLRKIPDDPGGLLRRKMYREYKKRGNENRNVQKVW